MLRRAIPFALVGFLIGARPAYAGDCGVEWMAAELDARARQEHPKESSNGYHLCLWYEVPEMREAQMAKRLLTSCARILAARPGDELCVNVAALLGKSDLGKTDIVEALAARGLGDLHDVDSLAATGSPKAWPPIVAAWQRLQPAADAKPRNFDVQNGWAAWRASACRALAVTGDAAARDFLAAQIEQKIDRGVKRAAAQAMAAIEARLAASGR